MTRIDICVNCGAYYEDRSVAGLLSVKPCPECGCKVWRVTSTLLLNAIHKGRKKEAKNDRH